MRQIAAILPGLIQRLDRMDWNEFDLVHVIHPQTGCVFDTVDVPVRKTLDWIDERTNVLERSMPMQSSLLERAAAQLEIGRIRRYQQRIGPLFDATFASSDGDADRLEASVSAARPTVVPNGVDTSYFANKRAPNALLPTKLLFTGHMGYEPNIDAVMYFWDEIWPLIVSKAPGLHLKIVGTSPAPEVKGLAESNPSQVTVTGRVDDMRPYLLEASICLAPLRTGSGTRLKILEAMSMGRPVVSTSIGCEGLNVRDEQNILIGDTPEVFAEAVIGLLGDHMRWERLSVNGRILVENHHDWSELAKPMARAWRELIA